MTPERAVRLIQCAWRDHLQRRMDEYYAQMEEEVSVYDMWPERPCDYDAVEEVMTFYNDLSWC